MQAIFRGECNKMYKHSFDNHLASITIQNAHTPLIQKSIECLMIFNILSNKQKVSRREVRLATGISEYKIAQILEEFVQKNIIKKEKVGKKFLYQLIDEKRR